MKSSVIERLIEQHKIIAESFAINTPKIDTSIFESINSVSSITFDKLIEQHKTIAESFAINTPKIDTSIFESINSVSSITFDKLIEQHKTIAESFAINTPKIDTSIFESINSVSSITFDKLIEQHKTIAESFAINTPKIDTSIFEELILNNTKLSEQNIINIETISEKINNNIKLTEIELFTYMKVIYFLMEKFIVIYTIYTIIFPDSKIELQLEKISMNQQEIKKTIQKSNKYKNSTGEIYYEVVKQVKVRENSNSSKKSKILDIIFPKQKLLVIRKKSKWIEVEYFDEKQQQTVTGWVFKKYTKRIYY